MWLTIFHDMQWLVIYLFPWSCMDLRLSFLSIKQEEINLESKFTTTGSLEDIECSSNFCLLSVIVVVLGIKVYIITFQK